MWNTEDFQGSGIILVRYCTGGFMILYICQNLENCTTQRANSNVIMDFLSWCVLWFINCNKFIALM